MTSLLLNLSTPPPPSSSDAATTPKRSRQSTPLSPASVLDTPTNDGSESSMDSPSIATASPPSLPLQPQQQVPSMTLPSLRHHDQEEEAPKSAAAKSAAAASSLEEAPPQHLLKQQQQQQQQPFFLLGWLEDLVPEDPQAFAEALKTAQTFQKKQHQQQPSPLQRFFSQFSRRHDDHYYFQPRRRGSASMPDLRRPPSLQLSDDVSAKSTPLQQPPPSTPKSSNKRRKNVMRARAHPDTMPDMACNLHEQQQFQEETTSSNSKAHQRWQERRKHRNAQKANCSVLQRSLVMAKQWNARGIKCVNTDYHAALQCWNNALEIYQGLHLQQHTANVQNNRGIVLGKLGRTDEAMEALTVALKLRRRKNNGNPSAIASTLHNMANVQQEAGDLGQALELLAQAKELLLLWEEHDDDDDIITPSSSSLPKFHQSARLCTAMGHVYAEAEHWRDAAEAYWDALQVYERLVKLLPEVVDDRKLLLQELNSVRKDLEELENRMALQEFSKEEGEHKYDDVLRLSYHDDSSHDDEDDGYAPWYYGNSAVDTSSPTAKTTTSASSYSYSWRQILPSR